MSVPVSDSVLLPPCPESWSSFRAEDHVGDSGARFAGCGGNRRLRLQLQGHGAVPKVETALLSCHWPSRGVLFPGRADSSCPQRSAFLPGLWTGSASRSCCPTAAGGGGGARGTAALHPGLPAQPGFVSRSSRKARPICGEEVGWGRLCRATQDGGRRRVTVTLDCLMGFASAELCGRPTGGLYISLLRGESCSPPDSYVKPPAPQNATLSGHRSLQTELVKTMSY